MVLKWVASFSLRMMAIVVAMSTAEMIVYKTKPTDLQFTVLSVAIALFWTIANFIEAFDEN